MADWKSLYPFASQEMRLSDGVRLHYIDEGSGDPLLFVHGNPTWSFYYRNLVTAFRGSHRTIAVDHVGCGLSDKPQDYPYHLSQHIDNLVHLIRHLDLKRCTLLAHDWGGAIGLGALQQERHRFSRIVLFNTGAFPPPFVPLRIDACRIPTLGEWGMRQLNLFAKAALIMATEKRERFTPEVCAGLLAPYDNWNNRVAIARFVQDIPQSVTDPTWKKLVAIESGLDSLKEMPISLIWGMKDWCFTPECLERFIKHWPQAEVHRLADCGHYVVEDAYERIIPLLQDFFQRRPTHAL